jgi:hypothetical protein
MADRYRNTIDLADLLIEAVFPETGAAVVGAASIAEDQKGTIRDTPLIRLRVGV